MSKADTKFGQRVVAELDDCFKINLPERYNAFTEKQLTELGGGKTYLINRGKHGKSYKLELGTAETVGVPKDTHHEQEEPPRGVDEVDNFDPDETSMGFYSQAFY